MVLGVVFNPCNGEFFLAERDRGATLNGRPLRVSATRSLERALLATGFPYDRKESLVNNYDHFINFQQAAQACRRPGAASLDLACVAAGRFDGYWEMKLKPWDVAAGVLLIEEAGGQVSDFDGLPMRVECGECLASNGLLQEAMQEVLKRGNRPERGR
jgi:myo-inositol-1(or 4)-monophosphatase